LTVHSLAVGIHAMKKKNWDFFWFCHFEPASIMPVELDIALVSQATCSVNGKQFY